jgi:NAD(P)-dependent dehydrogenase (short-subunit alcohol dehydrogenase family)
MLLKDKVVIVSGIGPGLGQELSTLAAKEGARAVVLAARTPGKLDVAEQEILDLGLGTAVLKVPTDIADRDQCLALAERAVQEFGCIDVLFNSAYDPGSFEPVELASMEGWRRAMDVNFFGTMHLTQACVGGYPGRLRGFQVRPALCHQTPGPGAGAIQYSRQQLPYGLDVGSQRGGLFRLAGQ